MSECDGGPRGLGSDCASIGSGGSRKSAKSCFKIVTENAADMIALVDVKGHRLYNSPAYKRILGYSAAELGGDSSFEQIHPEDRFKVLEAAREARSTGVGKKLEYRIRHKDGTWRVLESIAGTIRDEKGEVAKLVIVNRDVTDRKRAEERARAQFLSRWLDRACPTGVCSWIACSICLSGRSAIRSGSMRYCSSIWMVSRR